MDAGSFRNRVYFILFFFLVSFSFLIYRVINLHVFFKLPFYLHPSNNQIQERGRIYDSQNNTLAISQEEISIGINPKKETDLSRLKRILKKYFQLSDRAINSLIKSNKFRWLVRKLPREKIPELKEINTPGLIIQKEFKRYYPEGSLFSHVTGFVDIDNIGREGVEATFNNYLSGKYIPISENISLENQFHSSIKGNTVHLTIARTAQRILDKEIKKAYKETRAAGAFGILLDTRSGKIISLVSYPQFDANFFTRSTPEKRRNRAIMDIFEPGSTFKIFIAAALLEEKLISENDLFYCPGYIKKENHVFHCWGIHGELSFREVLKKSCNVGMIQAVNRLHPEKLYMYLKKFGFGNKTGISLSGEEKGILRFPNKWSSLSPYSLAIGYEISMTGLQLIRAASAIANQGYLIKPLILDFIEGKEEIILDKSRNQNGRKIISQNTAAQLMEMLHEVTLPGGTGGLAVPDKIQIAGKTGTAQKSLANKGYQSGKFVASFIGFFPYNNPKYSLLIVIDEPKGNYWGGKIAAPVFRKVTSQLIYYLNLLEYTKAKEISSVKIKEVDHSKIYMLDYLYDLRGLSTREVTFILQKLRKRFDFQFRLFGSGHVVNQRPEAGTYFQEIAENDFTVKIFLK